MVDCMRAYSYIKGVRPFSKLLNELGIGKKLKNGEKKN